MDFGHWIIPLLALIMVGGYILGKNIEQMCRFKKKQQRIVFWIILYILIICSIIFRTIWDAFAIYSLTFIAIFYLLVKFFEYIKQPVISKFIRKISYKGATAFVLSGILVGYGIWNVNNPIIKQYEIKIDHQLKEQSKITFISDLHLGTIKSNYLLDTIVNQANNEKPDVFLIIGDLYDEFTNKDLIEPAIQKLSQIKTKFGIYYVEGNHDLLTDNVRQLFMRNNIKTIEDSNVLINDNYYLLGRKDYRRNSRGEKRASLSSLVENLSSNYPIILLDHQPRVDESENNELIDLQLSGHTHAGQIFPANFILLNGYYKKNNLNLIVSSGYGVWNCAVRTAGRSEMVSVIIKN